MTVPKFAGGISDRALSDLVRPSAAPLREFVIPPSPNYAAKTAGGIERIASFQAASIQMSTAQRDELIALNAKVETLTTQAGTTKRATQDPGAVHHPALGVRAHPGGRRPRGGGGDPGSPAPPEQPNPDPDRDSGPQHHTLTGPTGEHEHPARGGGPHQ